MKLPRLVRCPCGEVCWNRHSLCFSCRDELDRWLANVQWIAHVEALERDS